MIQYQNISTIMSDAEVAAVMSAVAAQVNQDFARYWDCGVVGFQAVSKARTMDPKAWQFVIADTSDQAGAAGYHEVGSGGGPIGFAFAKTTLDAGMKPSVTISHEILEMIADPFIDQTAQWSDLPSPLFLAYEACDPVEDDSQGQVKHGIMLSDFVLPSYFVPGSAGPWDLMRHLMGPWDATKMLLGAYQATWDPTMGWAQVFPRVARQGRALPRYSSPLSRRSRRLKMVNVRRKSVR